MKTLYEKIILLIIFCLSVTASLSAQNISRQEDKKARLEREIAIIDKQLIDNVAKSRSELSQLNLIQTKLNYRRRLIKENERQIRVYSDEIYLTQKQINKLKARRDTLSNNYSTLIKCAYKNRDTKIWYMYIIASENLGQAFRRFSYFNDLADQLNLQAEKIEATTRELEAEKINIAKLKAGAENLKKQRSEELANLQNEERQTNSVIAALNSNKQKYQRELNAKKKQVEALDREIKRLLAAALAEKTPTPTTPNTTAKKPKVVIDYKLAGKFESNKGKLPWPVQGPVVERFGTNFHPVFKSLKLPKNNGISIATSASADVIAVFDGVVKQIVVMPGYNQCILVQHGNYFSFYCKLKTTAVSAGDKIKIGQVLGQVGEINGDTQLYFQIWKNQTPQNPEIWLR